MSVYIKLAWRNIFRNKRRTFITGTALAIGLAALMFLDGVFIGMADNMIGSATASFTGEAQIHARDFLQTQEAERTVANAEAVFAGLKTEDIIKDFTPRTLSPGMMTSAVGVHPVLLVGVRPETEKNVSQIDDAVVQGGFFSGDDDRNIVIGSKTAELLEVGLGDRVVVTVSQAGSGALSQDLFRISGIFRLNIDEIDGGAVFIRLGQAQKMLGLNNAIHEIALKFKDRRVSQDESHPFWARYSTPENEILGWTKLFPQMKGVYEFAQFSLLILGVIMFAMVSLGIINTLFMSIYERVFEFGVLRAVGTRPAGIRRLVVLEAGALALLSVALGIVLGFGAIIIVSKTGIDYRGMEWAGTTIREMIYPVMKLKQFLLYPACILLFTLFVGLYPAAFAAKMSVSKAMKKTL